MNGYKQIHQLLQKTLGEHSEFYLICESPETEIDTKGLQKEFPNQVLQLPCSDEAAIGIAVGLAVSGAHALLYLNGPQNIGTVISHLLSERFGAEFPLGITIRVPLSPAETIEHHHIDALYGSSITAIYASEASQTIAHLRESFGKTNVTIIFEDRESLFQNAETEAAQKSVVHQTGTHISLFAYGKDVNAARLLSEPHTHVEVVELIQLHPLDRDCIGQSMHKTGRALCVSPPQALFETLLDQSFWRLENQPQSLDRIDANRLQSKIETLMRY
ncbi:MAG: transketolase C-terminal domain-containing protein [Myxococcota bacterium]|nr:transketolase C-terminal domain-containing protein [Myxococcota bacterium]